MSGATTSTSQAEPKDQRRYHIVNVRTGTYAALLEDTDRMDVVNLVFKLSDQGNPGSEVERYLLYDFRG